MCDGSRTFAWGGSQGGQIVLLASAFAPNTFAVTVDCCGIADLTGRASGRDLTGALPMRANWTLTGHAAEIRSPLGWVDRIRSKVFVFHGTADDLVRVEHGRALERELREKGKECEAHFTEGGDHFLLPATTRQAQTIEHCTKDILSRRLEGPDDFERESSFRFECTGAAYVASFAEGGFTVKPETPSPTPR